MHASPVTINAASAEPVQLWGGVEASVIRVGDRWRDQVRETGHQDRPGDLERIAGLGIRTVRYPVLWERCTDPSGWQWADRQLGRLAELGVAPIVGLVHHGAGPAGANPLDPGWAEGVARHAALAAARYPWVTRWTPVNEPLTTARFSALYGHWFPHATDGASCDRMVFNQCRAVLLAMRAIREHIPQAQLVQTEDIGRTFSTPHLRYQANHDNARRWLSLDLLCGHVDRAHEAWAELAACGAPAAQLDEFRSLDAAPDLIGVNHYVTSDRFLDHRIARYPARLHTGNAFEPLVDSEAVRAGLPPRSTGWEPRLREVWARYGRPMAVTEVHLACDDDREPVRWLMEAWHAVAALRREGADIRAVTPWSLFGAVDWDSLLRQDRGHYEPGVWDVRHTVPRPMRLASAVASLARTGHYADPLLDDPGWWRRSGLVPV